MEFNWLPETNCKHCISKYGKIKFQDQPSLFNIHYAFIIMGAIEQARDTEGNQYCSPLNNHKLFYKKMLFHFIKWLQLKLLAAQVFCLTRNSLLLKEKPV